MNERLEQPIYQNLNVTIKKLNSDELILTTATTVPIARRRKKQVQTKIAQNIYEKAESIWNN